MQEEATRCCTYQWSTSQHQMTTMSLSLSGSQASLAATQVMTLSTAKTKRAGCTCRLARGSSSALQVGLHIHLQYSLKHDAHMSSLLCTPECHVRTARSSVAAFAHCLPSSLSGLLRLLSGHNQCNLNIQPLDTNIAERLLQA